MTIVKKIKASRIAKINDIMVEIPITINHNSKFTIVILFIELIVIYVEKVKSSKKVLDIKSQIKDMNLTDLFLQQYNFHRFCQSKTQISYETVEK